MKKIILIILAIIVVIGLIFVGVTIWAMNSNKRLNINNFQVSSLTSKNVELKNPTKVDLAIQTAYLNIQSGDKTELKMDNVSKDQYQITEQNGLLRVSEKDAQKHQTKLGKSPVLTLIVPQKTLESLQIDQLNGTVKLNSLKIGQLNIDHANGTTIAKDLTLLDSSRLTKKNGKTTFTGLKVSGLQVNVKNGQFKLNGKKQQNNYSQNGDEPLVIDSNNGQVSVTN